MEENKDLNMQNGMPVAPAMDPNAFPVDPANGMPAVPPMDPNMPPVDYSNGMPATPTLTPEGMPMEPANPTVEPAAVPMDNQNPVPVEAPTEAPAETVESDIQETSLDGMPSAIPNDMDSSTFDYNQLYANVTPKNMDPVESLDTPEDPAMEQAPIILGEEKKEEEPQKERDFVPAFDTSVFEEDIPEELRSKKEENLINKVTTETQEEKAQGRRNIFFLVILFGVLVVAVLLIFPLMTRY